MNRIETVPRNRLNTNTLEQLMSISIKGTLYMRLIASERINNYIFVG